jgi:hypothetical protein
MSNTSSSTHRESLVVSWQCLRFSYRYSGERCVLRVEMRSRGVLICSRSVVTCDLRGAARSVDGHVHASPKHSRLRGIERSRWVPMLSSHRAMALNNVCGRIHHAKFLQRRIVCNDSRNVPGIRSRIRLWPCLDLGSTVWCKFDPRWSESSELTLLDRSSHPSLRKNMSPTSPPAFSGLRLAGFGLLCWSSSSCPSKQGTDRHSKGTWTTKHSRT